MKKTWPDTKTLGITEKSLVADTGGGIFLGGFGNAPFLIKKNDHMHVNN